LHRIPLQNFAPNLAKVGPNLIAASTDAAIDLAFRGVFELQGRKDRWVVVVTGMSRADVPEGEAVFIEHSELPSTAHNEFAPGRLTTR
jgi:hypothetical protein